MARPVPFKLLPKQQLRAHIALTGSFFLCPRDVAQVHGVVCVSRVAGITGEPGWFRQVLMNVFFAVLLDEFSRSYVAEKAIAAHEREVPCAPRLRGSGRGPLFAPAACSCLACNCMNLLCLNLLLRPRMRQVVHRGCALLQSPLDTAHDILAAQTVRRPLARTRRAPNSWS